MSALTETRFLDQRRLLRALSRWMVLLVLLGHVGAGLAWVYAANRSRQYTATAELRLAQPSFLSGRAGLLPARDAAREATNELAILQSTQLLQNVQTELGPDIVVESELRPDSDVATVKATSNTQAGAVLTATAVAEQYIEQRNDDLHAQAASASDVIEQMLARVERQIRRQADTIPLNVLQAERTNLRDRLTDLTVALALDPSRPRIISEATARPVGLETLELLALGAIAGVFVGIGVALLMDRHYGRVTSSRDIEAMVQSAWSLDVSDPAGSRDQDIEQIRERYRPAAALLIARRYNTPSQVVLLAESGGTSNVGDVALSLACTLAAYESRVAVVDCGGNLPALVQEVQSLHGVEASDVRDSAAMAEEFGITLRHLSPTRDKSASRVSSVELSLILDELRCEHGFVLLVCPAVTAVSTAVAAPTADYALLVVQRGKTPLRSLQQSLGWCDNMGVTVAGVLLRSFSASRLSRRSSSRSRAHRSPALRAEA